MTGTDVKAMREKLKFGQAVFGRVVMKLEGSNNAVQKIVSKIENNIRKITGDELTAILQYRGVSVEPQTEPLLQKQTASVDKLFDAILEQQRTINVLREEMVAHGIEIGKLKDRLLDAARSGDIHRLDPYPMIQPTNN